MSFSIRVFFDNRFLTKKVLFFSPPIIRSDFYISKTRDGRIGKEFASSFFVGREAYRELRWLTSFLRPTSESKTKSIGVFSSSWIDSGHTPDGRRRILATYILSRFTFSSLSSQRLFSPKTRARTFKSWPFFFSCRPRAFHFPTSKLAFNGFRRRRTLAKSTTPSLLLSCRVTKDYWNAIVPCTKNIFLGNKKFRFSWKARILSFSIFFV